MPFPRKRPKGAAVAVPAKAAAAEPPATLPPATACYPHVVAPWPAPFRWLHGPVWETHLQLDHSVARNPLSDDLCGPWAAENEHSRQRIDELAAAVVALDREHRTVPKLARDPERRALMGKYLRDIDVLIVQLVRRDPRYIATEFVITRLLDAKMIVATHDQRISLEALGAGASAYRGIIVDEGDEGEMAAAEKRMAVDRRAARAALVEREAVVERERRFLGVLAGAVAESVGKGRGQVRSTEMVSWYFKNALDAATYVSREIRAAAPKSASARRALVARLQEKSWLHVDAIKVLVARPRRIREAALVDTAANFGADGDGSVDSIEHMVRGIRAADLPEG